VILFALDVNNLAAMMGDACYAFLTLNFLWGLYCIILIWRRVLSLKFKDDLVQNEFLQSIRQFLEANDFESAKKLCTDDPRALPQLALAVLDNTDLTEAQLRQLVAELMQRNVLGDLEYRLSWVATTIKSGPLLGLFGTVLGMMAAFGRMGSGEKPDPKIIASDISIALICTAMGLITAIPFSYLLASLNIRVRVLQDMLTSGLTKFLEHYKHTKNA
jgi:biopolymer transport protein ExbB/TolQ